MLVAYLEARSVCASRFPNPNLPVRMQPPSLRGRHGVEPGTVEQAGVRLAAVGMGTAIIRNSFRPRVLSLLPGSRVAEHGAIQLVLVQIDDDLVAVFNECDRTTQRCFGADMTNDQAD